MASLISNFRLSTKRSRENRLSCLPAEILIGIFTQLPSISDVISLAGTSRRLRHLYSDNAKPIYAAVGPRSFVFEQRARQLVVDGGGPGLNEGISLFYLASMGRNWQIIKRAMDEFEVQMKENIKSWKFGPIGPVGHTPRPTPHLTRREKRRFVRSYYTLWSLMRIVPESWDARLKLLSFRDLYYVHELCRLPQSIGREEYRPSSQKREQLRNVFWEHIRERHLTIHGKEVVGRGPLYRFPYGRFWDHWQFLLRMHVCGYTNGSPCTLVKPELWDMSDDEVEIE
ncbi:hypothetical protein BT63DRAFT_437417 [Microthyrium microscopicum]|uniref:F-box domain-containing protein n=1 Tax=Microthyrium microscopicum TaxID=703497 RepID=A0A6A6URW0_9PEZI|nr:hypothetical protein BT63DRAFT_437417 [Microthyrium microscopicum]